MKTLVLKELRETFWLAVLGFLVFTALLGSEYINYREGMAAMVRGEGEPRHLLQPLLGNAWEYTGFFCAIFAAVLGGLQMFNERLRNVWAFFFHRPMTPTALFLGKVAAGLGVYALVAGLPLLVFLAWVAQPGNVAAPFHWQMLMPMVAFYFGGIPYYLAGLLSGARRARWYGSRVFGLGAAFVVTTALVCTTQTWQVITALVLGTIVLGVAAWASFCNSGYDQGQQTAGKPALAVSLALGWVVAGAFAAVFLADIIERFRPAASWSYHLVMRDGSVCQIDQDAGRRFKISDLTGKTLLNPSTGEPMTSSEVQALRAETVYLQAPLSNFRRPRGVLFYRWGLYNYWGSSSGTLWYFVQPERRLAGYDAVSRRFIGSIGPNGFANTLAGDGFTILGSHSLGTSTTLVSVNLSKRAVTPVFSASPDDPITHVGDVVISGQNWTGTLVATRHKVNFISSEGKAIWTIDHSMRYPDSEECKAYALEPAGSFILWNGPSFQKLKNFPQPPPAQLTWVKDGRILQNTEVPIPWRPEKELRIQEHLIAAFAPPCLAALLPSCLGMEFLPVWHRLLAESTIAGFICAPCAWIIARRRKVSPGGCAAWSLGTLALGLPGLLALLSIEDAPPHETRRAPAPGIEIFEHRSAT